MARPRHGGIGPRAELFDRPPETPCAAPSPIGDSYSIESLDSKGNLVDNSATGGALLRWGYGFGTPVHDLPPAPPGEVLRGVGSGRFVDVPGFSTANGTHLDHWTATPAATTPGTGTRTRTSNSPSTATSA